MGNVVGMVVDVEGGRGVAVAVVGVGREVLNGVGDSACVLFSVQPTPRSDMIRTARRIKYPRFFIGEHYHVDMVVILIMVLPFADETSFPGGFLTELIVSKPQLNRMYTSRHLQFYRTGMRPN